MVKNNCLIKAVSIVLALVMLLGGSALFSFAAEEASVAEAEEQIEITDLIVDIAKSKIGFYESDINEFTTWYYGIETEASWCSIFVSWCADQVGALGSAVPKKASCLSMKKWFDRRGEYYPADSDYIPQKGDIVFWNTAVDGTDDIHHVEIVTQSGFITSGKTVKIKCIGGCTSDLNYNGSEYVTEKIRPVSGSRAELVGYAHPSYEKSEGIVGDIHNFIDDTTPSLFKYISAKIWEIIYRMEYIWEDFLDLFSTQAQ